MKLVEIQQRMYGDYKCSCGCGTQLIGLCCGVGDEEDINGYDWRMFDLNCWGNIKMHQHKTLEEIYNEYQPSEDFECSGYDVPAYEYDDEWEEKYEWED